LFFPGWQKVFLPNWKGIECAKNRTGENMVFINTKKFPIIKNKVRKFEDQNEYDCHCLWKDVTFNLKIRNTDATEAKQTWKTN
jgi:hypothetical protein